MTIDKIRANVKGSVWRGIAQSKADLSALQADEQNRLVDSITDSVLIAVNEVLDDAQKEARAAVPAEKLTGDETVLWEGRPFLSMVEFYTITSERIKIVKGMFGKDIENLELVRLQDIDLSQNLSERLFNIGDIQIRGADPSHPLVVLRNVANPQDVYEILRRAWLEARKRYGLQFREML
jgi:membrane protein YdbS with pleckstrin-like domain